MPSYSTPAQTRTFQAPRRNTHRLLLAVLLQLILLAGLAGQAAAEFGGGDRHFLWKVSSKSNHIYLLGSIHLLREQNYPLPSAFQQAFADTDTLVLEVDPAEMELPATREFILSRALFPAGQGFDQSVSPETYQATNREAMALGLDMTALNHYRPWFVALTLTNVKLQQLGFDPSHGIDMHFYQRAKKFGRQIESLETSIFQIDLFASMPEETQDLLLQQALEDMHNIEAEFDKLIAAWQRGDDKKLARLLLESFNGFPEILDRLINDRNRNWLAKLEELLRRDQPALVVVGAGHLLSDQGLISLLAEKGYRIEQL